MKNLKYGFLFLALVGIGLGACKKTELEEVKDFKTENSNNEKSQILAPPSRSWTMFLCNLDHGSGRVVFGYMCMGAPGICNTFVPVCTPFSQQPSPLGSPNLSEVGSSSLGEVLTHELIIVDNEMINNNMSLFKPLIDNGTITVEQK